MLAYGRERTVQVENDRPNHRELPLHAGPHVSGQGDGRCTSVTKDAVRGWSQHAVSAIVMEEHPLPIRPLPHLAAQQPNLIHCVTESVSVLELGTLLPLGVLLFEALEDALFASRSADGGRVVSAL